MGAAKAEPAKTTELTVNTNQFFKLDKVMLEYPS
jgi:hypothetical protein